MPHDRQIPNAEECRGKREQGDCHCEGGFLSTGAFEELERDEPRGEEAEKYARDEDVKDEEVGGDQGNHERPPLGLLNGFHGLSSS